MTKVVAGFLFPASSMPSQRSRWAASSVRRAGRMNAAHRRRHSVTSGIPTIKILS
ncbi:hypothetical protein [Cupriavidus oxalaticus]|uniref:hypothetical protein n=1 Tax=Cupriavidus oxalaticus TaxID=96344 RepID=UPI00142ED5D9|nr:hypothetical protein [Cupriavidus oxalaticus]